MLALVLVLNFIVIQLAKNQVYSSVKNIPSKQTALVLGTSKYVGSGNVNLFYKYRIEATIKLYKAGKIKYIIISGDNSRSSYDEPTTMKEDLIAAGIPAGVIYLDYAGFRTLDSIVRCKKIFGQKDIIVVSQKFHNERALFLARAHNISAVGYNATDIHGRFGFKTHVREYLARTKMFIDVFFDKRPKFLGDEVKVG